MPTNTLSVMPFQSNKLKKKEYDIGNTINETYASKNGSEKIYGHF